MKLKATIEEKRIKALKEIKGKPEAEKTYYEGIVAALDWVLGSRETNEGINGFKMESL